MTTDFSELLQVSREEYDALNEVFCQFNSSAPIKITYDNIVVHEFCTDMRANPRGVFNEVLDFAEKEIDAIVKNASVDSVAKRLDNWTLKTRFMTIHICLHCYTEYDQSDFVFEDTAIHRGVVSIVAYFDAKYIYREDGHNVEVFDTVTELYIDLRKALA
jgi:hypothetical protein